MNLSFYASSLLWFKNYGMPNTEREGASVPSIEFGVAPPSFWMHSMPEKSVKEIYKRSQKSERDTHVQALIRLAPRGGHGRSEVRKCGLLCILLEHEASVEQNAGFCLSQGKLHKLFPGRVVRRVPQQRPLPKNTVEMKHRISPSNRSLSKLSEYASMHLCHEQLHLG